MSVFDELKDFFDKKEDRIEEWSPTYGNNIRTCMFGDLKLLNAKQKEKVKAMLDNRELGTALFDAEVVKECADGNQVISGTTAEIQWDPETDAIYAEVGTRKFLIDENEFIVASVLEKEKNNERKFGEKEKIVKQEYDDVMALRQFSQPMYLGESEGYACDFSGTIYGLYSTERGLLQKTSEPIEVNEDGFMLTTTHTYLEKSFYDKAGIETGVERDFS